MTHLIGTATTDQLDAMRDKIAERVAEADALVTALANAPVELLPYINQTQIMRDIDILRAKAAAMELDLKYYETAK